MESANKMELTYTNVNGYLIPNLTYKSGEQMEQLGNYDSNDCRSNKTIQKKCGIKFLRCFYLEVFRGLQC